jgi:replication fork clamp-binding protein CrfC
MSVLYLLRGVIKITLKISQKCSLSCISGIFLLDLYYNPNRKEETQMTLGGYTYQVGDLFTTSKTGVTGRIEKFVPMRQNVTKVMLRLANNQTRFAMVKTY